MNAILPIRTDPAEVPTVYDLAKAALIKAKLSQSLDQELEQLKPTFRKHGQTITIPGVGKVTFKAGQAPGTVAAHVATTFHLEAYKLLPTEMKAKLKKLGVISCTQVPETTTNGSNAEIGYVPNV